MNKLLKSLQTFALAYNEGKCSVDTLIKACGAYKAKTGFVDNLEYELKVAKSCIDSINGVERDDKICKAIIPFFTNIISSIKSPSLINISPLTDKQDLNEVTTFTIKLEFSTDFKRLKF